MPKRNEISKPLHRWATTSYKIIKIGSKFEHTRLYNIYTKRLEQNEHTIDLWSIIHYTRTRTHIRCANLWQTHRMHVCAHVYQTKGTFICQVSGISKGALTKSKCCGNTSLASPMGNGVTVETKNAQSQFLHPLTNFYLDFGRERSRGSWKRRRHDAMANIGETMASLHNSTTVYLFSANETNSTHEKNKTK